MAAGRLPLTKPPAAQNVSKAGFTLVESMIAMAVLVIAALGALEYQYHAATRQQLAAKKQLATQNAQLLLQDWAASLSRGDYDPQTMWMGFTRQSDGTYLGSCEQSKLTYMLQSETAMDDQTANVTLKKLSVTVFEPDDRQSQKQLMQLATCVRLDSD